MCGFISGRDLERREPTPEAPPPAVPKAVPPHPANEIVQQLSNTRSDIRGSFGFVRQSLDTRLKAIESKLNIEDNKFPELPVVPYCYPYGKFKYRTTIHPPENKYCYSDKMCAIGKKSCGKSEWEIPRTAKGPFGGLLSKWGGVPQRLQLKQN